DEAERNGLIAYDIMTERFEVTSILQKLIASEESVFGTITKGSPDDPAVVKSSIHHLSKVVAGRQLKRPWWFFDTSVQGEGLVDITTHLVDLTFWILYPEQAIDYKTDIEMGASKHWPTLLSLDQYSTITAKPQFPDQFELDANGNYPYYCNGQANFSVKGVNVRAEVIWNYEAPKGTGDTHYSIIKGTKANILILQEKEQNFIPELYIEPAPGTDSTELGKALKLFIGSLGHYPNISVHDEKGRWRIDIPGEYRIGHEAHFGQVADHFLELLGGEPMPEWEKSNMLAKYYVTTKALEMCRE
ncbi:putative oxidoreductase C-terminal domain-containing protein, partial [Candidatus Latescibacterota bacterium]